MTNLTGNIIRVPQEIRDDDERAMIQSLASKAEGGAVVIIYNQVEVWQDRKAAMAFYLDCMYNSEGAENERYQNVFFDLMEDSVICYDGVTKFLTQETLFK